MKKLITLLLTLAISYLFSLVANANTQDSLAIDNWDFDAIKASHVISSSNTSHKEKKRCTPTVKDFSKFKKQETETLFSTDNCFVYSISKDGWVIKTDVQTKEVLAKIRVGLKVANTTLSKDNNILLIGNRQPADLVLLNTQDLSIARIIPVKNRKGLLSPVAKVGTASDEQGFIVAPQNFSKIWKINYQNPAPIGFGDGWNHDYRCMKEHVNKSLFPIKRLKTKHLLEDFYLDDDGIFLIGRDKLGKGIVMDLDLSRITFHPKAQKIGSGLIWKTEDTNYLATLSRTLNKSIDNNNNSQLNIYSNKEGSNQWKNTKTIPVKSAITVSSCPQSPALWVSTKDSTVLLIDKKTFKITKTIPLENKTIIRKMSCLPDNKGILLIDQDKKATIYNKQTFEKITDRF